jgi:hypothetical protein
MDSNQYKAERRRLDALTKQNLLDLAQWAEKGALPWLWTELDGILGKKGRIRPLQPQDAIRHGLQTTFADRKRMPQTPKFYVAQLTMLDSELTRYFRAIQLFAATSAPYAANASMYVLHEALKDCLDDGIVLLEQAGHFILNLPFAYGAWSRRVEHAFEIFKGAEQIVYGRFSGLTRDDRAPFTPVAVLRTAIEFRIRSAFGIQGYEDSSNNSFVPIDLSSLFEEIGPRLARIDFAVDFHDIVKVYKWCNAYLHGGWRDFVWVPGYALQFLRPLFADNRPTRGGGLSLDGGVRMPREVWHEIRGAFDRSNARSGLMAELRNAIRYAFSHRKSGRRLVLNPAEEDNAACVFLD